MPAKNVPACKIKEENDAVPLKRLANCCTCGEPLCGYIVHRKNICYYKCRTSDCCNNKNAKSLNQSFEKILEYFRLDDAAGMLLSIKIQTTATFNQLTKGREEENQLFRKQLNDLNKKIERLEERYIEEEVKADLYNKYVEKTSLKNSRLNTGY